MSYHTGSPSDEADAREKWACHVLLPQGLDVPLFRSGLTWPRGLCSLQGRQTHPSHGKRVVALRCERGQSKHVQLPLRLVYKSCVMDGEKNAGCLCDGSKKDNVVIIHLWLELT